MLVPLYLGICAVDADVGHKAAETLMQNDVVTAFLVAIAHTLAMTVAGGLIALVIYHWLGLKFLSKTWFNLDIVWALSLVLVGIAGIWMAYAGH
jgi:CBS domain containing-hemolysin-like protein